LSEEKKQQVIALGKLGWPLRRIEQGTGVRRETASAYLKAAGVVVCLPGWGRRAPAKPAMLVTTDSGGSSGNQGLPTHPEPSASTCEPCRERIEQGLARGRNAMAIWQDLVSDHGFAGGYQTVKRFRDRGKLDLSEAFVDASFSSAKKGAPPSALLDAVRAAKSWRSATAMVFLSPCMWPALRHMKPNSSKPRSKSDSSPTSRAADWRSRLRQ
jgi:hypothetical protein